MIMFHNLYRLSSTGYMNLGRALFLHDLITSKEIDVCSHIFHILAKTAEQTTSRNCIPFYRLISKILKLKGVHPLEDEYPYPQPSPINIHTLNASISHTKKSTKQESHATPRSSSFTSHAYDEKLDNIVATIQEINTKISELATIMHSQHIHFDTKFTSLQTQLDQIQRMLEKHGDQLFHDKKGDMAIDRGRRSQNCCLFVYLHYFPLKLKYFGFNFQFNIQYMCLFHCFVAFFFFFVLLDVAKLS